MIFFFALRGIQGRVSKYLYLSCKDIELLSFLIHILPFPSNQPLTAEDTNTRP